MRKYWWNYIIVVVRCCSLSGCPVLKACIINSGGHSPAEAVAVCLDRPWTGGPVNIFIENSKVSFWSTLPLPIFILCGGTGCIWTCYISSSPWLDSLLLCSLQFMLLPWLLSLHPLTPHPPPRFNLKHHFHYQGTCLSPVSRLSLSERCVPACPAPDVCSSF